MVVRSATTADAPEIARVQTESWEGAYRGLVPDRLFAILTIEARTQQWSRFFEVEPPRSQVFVAEDRSSRVVGMAAVGPTRDDDLDPGTVGEVAAIYVTPDAWGAGHGRDLMVRATAWLAEARFVEAALWVLDVNERGRSFYESGGWTADGSSKRDDSFGEPLDEIRYRIRLPPA